MEKVTKNSKRRTVILIPYKKEINGEFLIYLQKRGKDVKRAPGKFGFFGGGAKNKDEKLKDVLLREIKEELNFTPRDFWYLGHYDFERKELFAYCQQVDDNFEAQIKILEGDFGRWFSRKELSQEINLIDDDKPVFNDFFQKSKIM